MPAGIISSLGVSSLFCRRAIVVILTVLFILPVTGDRLCMATSAGGGGGGGARGVSPGYLNRLEMRKREREIKEKQLQEQKKWEEFEKSFENIDTSAPTPKKAVSRAPVLRLPAGHPETQGELSSVRFLLQRNMFGIDKRFAQEVWGNPKRALRKYKSRQKNAQKKGAVAYRHKTSMDLGNCYYLLGLYSKAKDSFQEAIQKDSDQLPANDRSFAMNSLAAVNEAYGNYKDARETYGNSLKIFQQTNNQQGQSMVLMNIAVMDLNRGKLESAFDYINKSINVSKGGEVKHHILNLMGAGRGLRKSGYMEQAVLMFDQAIQTAKESGEQGKIYELLIDKANTLMSMDLNDQALDSFKSALKELDQNQPLAFQINHAIGNILMDQGKIDDAEKYIKRGKYNSDLARLALLRNDLDMARRLFDQLRGNAKKYNRTSDLFAAHLGLGKVYENKGRTGQATRMYGKAVELAESIRAGQLLSERPRFFITPISGFKPIEAGNGLVRTNLKMKRYAKSIYPGEVSKARSFADNIARRADVSKLGVDEKILQEEEELFNRLAALKKGLAVIPRHLDSKRYNEIAHEIKKTEKLILDFEKKIKNSHKTYAAVRFPDPVKLSDAKLQPDEYYLVYDVTTNGVAIRVLKGKKILYGKFKKIQADELNGMVRELRSSFEQVRLGSFNVEVAKKLYDILLKEPLSKIPENTPITIAPDDILTILPFEALVVQGEPEWKAAQWGPYPGGLKYLFDRNPIHFRQSLTAITIGRQLEFGKNDGKSLLVLADPVFSVSDDRVGKAYASKSGLKQKGDNVKVMAPSDGSSLLGIKLSRLKSTGKLAESLGSLFQSDAKVFRGMAANKSVLFSPAGQDLEKFRWIVFATHGYAGSDVPGIMEPFIALSMAPEKSGEFMVMRMTEALNLDLNAELVALTACQTGQGKIVPGEGVISLGRAFQCAGARSTLASLWSVSEITSVNLIEDFFKKMKEGLPVGAAWRKAKEELRSSGYDHPFFWAPFILVGEIK